MKRYRRGKKIFVKIYDRLFDFFGPQNWWPADSPVEVVVGAVLTQNTAWSNVEKAISNLKKEVSVSCASEIVSLKRSRLTRLIKPAGYYNLKANRLSNVLNYILDCGGLPAMSHLTTDDLRKGLLSVNGVGPETCDSILLYALGRPVFVVDAYTKRIFARHNLVSEDDTYDFVQRTFTEALDIDKNLFGEYHALIVRLAKDYCKRRPNCGECPLKGLK